MLSTFFIKFYWNFRLKQQPGYNEQILAAGPDLFVKTELKPNSLNKTQA